MPPLTSRKRGNTSACGGSSALVLVLLCLCPFSRLLHTVVGVAPADGASCGGGGNKNQESGG